MLTHPRVLLAEEGLQLELQLHHQAHMAKLLAVKASYPDNIACQVFDPAYYSTLGDA